jgi:hypothetical protein
MGAESCSDNIEKIFDVPPVDGDKKFRYFNQPIEQIPNYEESSPQILVHRPYGGLQWATIDQCIKVVTCLKLDVSQLKIERRQIVVFKDFEVIDDFEECSNIELTDCEAEENGYQG